MVANRRAGFTLAETLVALTLSSLLVVMVSTVFLVQNRYYALQLERTATQDNARTVTEMVASEVRSISSGGVVIADNDHLVVRSPIVLAVVCAQPTGSRVSVHFEGGEGDLDTDEVSGFAVQDPSTLDWSYYDVDWSTINQSGGTPAGDCAANGADTVGAYDEFKQLRRLGNYHGSLPDIGDILMLYRNVEYQFATSEMDTSTIGLFRGIYGGTLTEFATGMDTTAQFQYRTGGTTYANSVTGGSLDAIDAIRIGAHARRRPQTGGVDDVTFGWSVNVFLRNGG